VRLLSNATVTAAARTLGVSAETIDGLRDRWSERAVAWTAWAGLGVSGLDESALTRGPRDCVTLVTAPLEGGGVAIVAVLAARQQEPGAACRRAIPAPLRPPLERACTAMYAGFVRARADEGPGAESVIERFPGARAYRDGADTGRQKALKRVKRAWPEAA
jgi:hypothetical protein